MAANEPAADPRAGAAVVADKNSQSHHPAIIAMDGPAASGKSTVGHRVAQVLGYLYFDTGVMYRAVTWAALDRGLSVQDLDAVGHLAETIVMDIAPAADQGDGRPNTILVDGVDVTWQIRLPEVDRNVSAVAANPRVRAALTVQQRRIGLRYGSGQADLPGIVMLGRDIGTVVLPEAPLKIYLDAPVEERARRRYQESVDGGRPADFAQVLADMRRRDKVDSERATAPLRAADDAITLDSTGLTLEQVVARILDLVTGLGVGG
ncbi:MAG: (d)CMP kinase [Caldilineaceae bacterium]|nr:(d)CMP kinase [Caldilineaceae bacterium]MBP8108278.1 (d)CMP kinase [Caldilineaceae bacterium]MBP8123147.1 (d)CMP kinase [Caldilineaceae bacterium]MBP9073505.1 (d)CMP kinase [Caldilineaceae bacterium]